MRYEKITNKTDRPLGLGTLILLPEQTVNVPDEYKNNPTIDLLVASGELIGVEEINASQTKQDDIQPIPLVDPNKPTQEEIEAQIAKIKKMKRGELDEFARQIGVIIDEHDTVESLSAKLIEAVKGE